MTNPEQSPPLASQATGRRVLTRRACLLGLGAGALTVRPVWSAPELVVGYLYVGSRHDYGYNESHARAAQAVAALPGVRLVEQERVPESGAAAAVMEAMIVEEGARLLYPTSYGYYDPHILRLATKYPEVTFRHCGGAWRKDQDPTNIGSYFGHMHEGQHLVGLVAGSVARDTNLGFVASNRYPGVLRNINAFALGARLANPDVSVQVIFTGTWSDPVREAEAVNALADQGSSVIGCSVDSARTVVETARRRGIQACGYNASCATLGSDSYLTAALAHWGSLNQHTVQQVQAGVRPPNLFSGGLREGIVTIDELGPVVDAATSATVRARQARLVAGTDWIWAGPLVDNSGKEIVPAGQRIEREDPLLRKMNWFVQGVRA